MDQADETPLEDVKAVGPKASRPRSSGGVRAGRAELAQAFDQGSAPGTEREPSSAVAAFEGAVNESAAFGEDATHAAAETFSEPAAETVHAGEAVAAELAQQIADPASAGLKQAQDWAAHGMETVMKTAEDMIAFGQGNVEALMKSGQIWATGLQDISKQMAATAQAHLDETMTSFKAFSGVKSLKDMIDLQSQFARAAMEKTMAETGRLTDASLKLAEQAMAPITARVTLAVETVAKPA